MLSSGGRLEELTFDLGCLTVSVSVKGNWTDEQSKERPHGLTNGYMSLLSLHSLLAIHERPIWNSGTGTTGLVFPLK